jgi:hypothetical protein
LIAWCLGEERFYFYLGAYNEIIYRLVIRNRVSIDELPKHFWMIKIGPHAQDEVFNHAEPRHHSELSFHFTEVSSIKGNDLVRFAGDCFQCADNQDIYPWPLFFESGKWKRRYAWTLLGKIEQTKREHAYRAQHERLLQ